MYLGARNTLLKGVCIVCGGGGVFVSASCVYMSMSCECLCHMCVSVMCMCVYVMCVWCVTNS